MHGKAIEEWNQRQKADEKKKKRRNKGNLLSQWRKREKEKTRHADEIQAKYAGT